MNPKPIHIHKASKAMFIELTYDELYEGNNYSRHAQVVKFLALRLRFKIIPRHLVTVMLS